MHGNPFRELLLVLVLMAALAPMILRLTTRPRAVAPTAAVEQQTDLVSTGVRLEFAHAPLAAGLGSLMEIEVQEGQTEYEASVPIDLSERILESAFFARWPEDTPRTAVTISLEPEGLEERTVTFWSEGDLDEFVELHWDD